MRKLLVILLLISSGAVGSGSAFASQQQLNQNAYFIDAQNE